MGSEAVKSVTLRVKKKVLFLCWRNRGVLEGALTLDLIPIDAPGDASKLRCGNSCLLLVSNCTQ